MDVESMLGEIRALSLDDRIEFIQRAWDETIDESWLPELTDEMRSELDRRSQDLATNPDNGLTWEAIVSHVRRER